MFKNCIVADDFKHGENFEIGNFCVIEPDVVVGDNVRLGHFVMLKSGTRILNNVDFADYCKTTGICIIGNHVAVRTASCISKGVIVNDWAFIGAGIMSSHTKHIYHGRPSAPRKQYITRIGYGAVIGSRTNLMAGVRIAPGAVIGYNSSVTRDLVASHGLYFNRPNQVASYQRTIEPGEDMYIEVPTNYAPHKFDKEMLKEYLPYA